MAHSLPELTFVPNALEPHIDAKTIEIHHGKHHAAYVAKLNAAIEGNAEVEGKTIEELIKNISKVPESIQTAVRNNGGQHYNHSLYWKVIAPNAGGEPTGDLAEAINRDFGSFEGLKEKLSNAAATQFGSGWAWLCVSDGKLCVCATSNQETPLMDDAKCKGIPILTIDVWEHAYYLNYQNRRPDYISAFWNVINWNAVSELYSSAIK